MTTSDIAHLPAMHLLGRGLWRNLLARFPRPVLAFGEQSLFRVMLHGAGFVLPIGTAEPASGFVTAVFVAATTLRRRQ